MASTAQLVTLRRAAGYNLLATAGVVMVAIFLLCALFAPWIAPQDQRRSTFQRDSWRRRPRTGLALTNWDATSSRASSTGRASRCWWAVAWSQPRSRWD